MITHIKTFCIYCNQNRKFKKQYSYEFVRQINILKKNIYKGYMDTYKCQSCNLYIENDNNSFYFKSNNDSLFFDKGKKIIILNLSLPTKNFIYTIENSNDEQFISLAKKIAHKREIFIQNLIFE